MNILSALLPVVQIVLALLLVGGVLLQQRGAGLGGAFGGGLEETNFNTRRGAELFIFRATIVVAVLFTVSALIAFII